MRKSISFALCVFMSVLVIKGVGPEKKTFIVE